MTNARKHAGGSYKRRQKMRGLMKTFDAKAEAWNERREYRENAGPTPWIVIDSMTFYKVDPAYKEANVAITRPKKSWNLPKPVSNAKAEQYFRNTASQKRVTESPAV